MPGIVHFSQSAAVETAVVYSQRRLAHSRAEEEGQARAEARGELMVPEVLIWAGPTKSRANLRKSLGADPGTRKGIPIQPLAYSYSQSSPADFARHYAKTDRERDASNPSQRLTSTSSSARRLRGAPKTYPDLDARSVPYTSQGNARGAPPSLRGTGARPSGR